MAWNLAIFFVLAFSFCLLQDEGVDTRVTLMRLRNNINEGRAFRAIDAVSLLFDSVRSEINECE